MAQNQGGTSPLFPDFEIAITFSHLFRPAYGLPSLSPLSTSILCSCFDVFSLRRRRFANIATPPL